MSFSVTPGLEELAPYLIRGHPETHENTGFRLEFIPMKIGAGMTTFKKAVFYGQTLNGYCEFVLCTSR
jgi:hypothetical protein